MLAGAIGLDAAAVPTVVRSGVLGSTGALGGTFATTDGVVAVDEPGASGVAAALAG